MRVGIDFDRVLFDTDAFNEYLKEKAGLRHVDADVYDEHGNYDPAKHAEACGVPVEKVYDAMNDLEQFLFDDVELLEKLDDVVIVTRGEKGFQERKIHATSVLEYVDDFFVIEDGVKDVDDIEFLVDDREEEIERSGVPGMVFDRERHGIEDLIEKVAALEA